MSDEHKEEENKIGEGIRRQISWQYVILTITLALISGGPTFIMAWKAESQATEAKDQSKETHDAVNSRLDEFIKTYKQAATDAALLKERKDVSERKEKKDHEEEMLPNAVDTSRQRKTK